MYKLADLMEKHAEEFAQLETLVSGFSNTRCRTPIPCLGVRVLKEP
jgi:hypothetical protein